MELVHPAALVAPGVQAHGRIIPMDASTLQKVCASCKEPRELAAFAPCARTRDRLQAYCKSCNREAGRRWRLKRGMKVIPKSAPPIRFWAKVDKRGPDDCWEWQAARMKCGYGQFRFRGAMVLAHRFAWEQANGPITDPKLCVCHKCDNPACCNPAHHFLGDRRDNIHDAMSKRRMKFQQPEARSWPRSEKGQWRKRSVEPSPARAASRR